MEQQQEKKQQQKKPSLERLNELKDLKDVLDMPAGRRLLWRFMAHAKVFESIWSPSAAIHYQSGQQDFGHFILTEILEADGKSYLKMIEESQIKEGILNG